MLRRHAPLFVVTHFNHPVECTPEARAACEALVDHGVPVENQSVLLRGVNSSARILIDLNERLLTFRARPYYLHQGDLAEGTAHLRTPLEAGVAILEAMRGRTSGLAIPHLAVDLPDGGGKITLQPSYLVGREGGAHALRSHKGGRYLLPGSAVRRRELPVRADLLRRRRALTGVATPPSPRPPRRGGGRAGTRRCRARSRRAPRRR